ncbi:hypothetical protein H0A61_00575 [Koleobacter methoxysyntrophicus]|uniref:Uncharacterized protein n=1 Tax=Koleobacter methoxysyntrophicus TaxID=2751313 RepID=A0A8A0RIZ2_9FIRM|nr:hypothetical protein [Koleobacter methoxysyntrophicus]QSQ08255.1 hypothetical protein H0A61_00575 [Koleobacter methoxysyntrophicus]
MSDLLKTTIISSLVTLLVGFFGYRYALLQLREQMKMDFYIKQLKDFYSPLLGYRNEILAKSEVRLKIEEVSNEAWRERIELLQRKNPNFPIGYDGEKEIGPYKKIIDYNNNQFEKDLLPKYKMMLKIFTDNYWLSEPETRKWYKELCEFIDIWDRFLKGTLPNDVVRKLSHMEKKLDGFYQDLEKQLEKLRKKIKNE